jgi:hypothetical protein
MPRAFFLEIPPSRRVSLKERHHSDSIAEPEWFVPAKPTPGQGGTNQIGRVF